MFGRILKFIVAKKFICEFVVEFQVEAVELKLGNYACPDVSLKESIENAKKIYDRFKDEEIDSQLASETIGYRGGAFLARLAALRKYGLVSPRGRVAITDLGKRITYPVNRDVELSAIEEAIKNVELFKILYDKFGVELPKEKLWVNLRAITGAEAPDAQEKEDIIRQIYTDSVKPLMSKERVGIAELPSELRVVEPDFATFETEDFKIQIRKDLRTIEFAKTKLMEVVMPWLDYVESKLKVKEGEKNA